jgi:AmmeMemoRadiSam system protein B
VLAEALAQLRKKRDLLFVASSDLSHFPDYATAVAKDREFLQSVLAGDPDAVEKTDRKILGEGYENFHCTHCGREPLQTLMRYALQQGAEKTILLQYRNSGDTTNDRSRVVGYAAVAFCK